MAGKKNPRNNESPRSVYFSCVIKKVLLSARYIRVFPLYIFYSFLVTSRYSRILQYLTTVFFRARYHLLIPELSTIRAKETKV